MKKRAVNTILVVDDTEVIRDLLSEVLQNDGYHVDKAANGIEAVEMVTRNQYDLVITDVHMPRQNGLITARKVRQISPSTFVILTDSYPDKLGMAAQKEGAVGVICKPFDLTELRRLLADIEELAAQRLRTVGGG